MTLNDLINKLLLIAKSKPNINQVGEGDIYELNHIPNVNYSVFYITQDTHEVYENRTEYTLNLFYIDRLLNDKSNQLQIQSVGIDAITNIVNELLYTWDVDVVYPLTFTPFNQRFADDCAGVYAKLTIITDNNGICTYD